MAGNALCRDPAAGPLVPRSAVGQAWFHPGKRRGLFPGALSKGCYRGGPRLLPGNTEGGLLPRLLPAHRLVSLPTVRKGYRIQADKERDSMKVLYYVEKELAQFDPARRMRGRCEHLWLGFLWSGHHAGVRGSGPRRGGDPARAALGVRGSEPAGVLAAPPPEMQKCGEGTRGVTSRAIADPPPHPR